MKDARKLTRSFVGLGSILFILVDLTLLPLYPIGIQLFHPSKAIISLVFQIFIVALVMHFLSWSVSFVLPSALRAAGDAKFTTIVSLLSMWCFRIGGGYVVGIVLSYGLIGIFVVMCLEWSLRGTIFILRFKGQRWLQHNLI
jgi:Na+-driven multidrug efflux pump